MKKLMVQNYKKKIFVGTYFSNKKKPNVVQQFEGIFSSRCKTTQSKRWPFYSQPSTVHERRQVSNSDRRTNLQPFRTLSADYKPKTITRESLIRSRFSPKQTSVNQRAKKKISQIRHLIATTGAQLRH